ncbi:hypothetical protein, partial [Lactococcus petauri]|uniref:hypothetical protein n=1 Tax=Lactococcus petauri TaxID=1940789 RepID=UPI00288CF6A3
CPYSIQPKKLSLVPLGFSRSLFVRKTPTRENPYGVVIDKDRRSTKMGEKATIYVLSLLP